MLRYAYECGAFPMADEDDQIEFYSVQRRCLFPISGIKVSSSLDKVVKKAAYEVKIDQDFEQIIRSCRRPEGNWINEEIIRLYCEIFEEGWGHCLGIWIDGELSGGIYGITIGSCFCGESMFHRRTNASKLALYHMVNAARENGCTLFDAQIWNPHLASLGAYEIDADEYMKLLAESLRRGSNWDALSSKTDR